MVVLIFIFSLFGVRVYVFIVILGYFESSKVLKYLKLRCGYGVSGYLFFL